MIPKYRNSNGGKVSFSSKKNKWIWQRYSYTTSEWKEVEIDSTTELEFFEYCNNRWIKILDYWEERYRYIEDNFAQNIKESTVNALKDYFPWVKKLRKPESSFYKPDAKIEVMWIEWFVEIKSWYTKKLSHKDKEADTAYHLKRNMFLSKYSDANFLEVTKVGWNFIFEVYSSNEI